MNGIPSIAKLLIIFGLIMIVVGLLLFLLDKLPFFSFRLPGDILIRRKNFVFYFPLGLCILISILLTLFFRLLR